MPSEPQLNERDLKQFIAAAENNPLFKSTIEGLLGKWEPSMSKPKETYYTTTGAAAKLGIPRTTFVEAIAKRKLKPSAVVDGKPVYSQKWVNAFQPKNGKTIQERLDDADAESLAIEKEMEGWDKLTEAQRTALEARIKALSVEIDSIKKESSNRVKSNRETAVKADLLSKKLRIRTRK